MRCGIISESRVYVMTLSLAGQIFPCSAFKLGYLIHTIYLHRFFMNGDIDCMSKMQVRCFFRGSNSGSISGKEQMGRGRFFFFLVFVCCCCRFFTVNFFDFHIGKGFLRGVCIDERTRKKSGRVPCSKPLVLYASQ